MSRLLDAAQLALTKLKTRRVRLAITIIISSVLFCLLLAIAFVVNGSLESIEKFRESGFSSRYIVSAYPFVTSDELIKDPSLIAEAQDMQKKTIDKKKAEAARLKIDYDPGRETPYITEIDQEGMKGKTLNTSVSEVQALLQQKMKEQPGGVADFNKVVERYGVAAAYGSRSTYGAGMNDSGGGTYLKHLKNDKEDFTRQRQLSSAPYRYESSDINSLSSTWQLFSGELLRPFLLQGQNLKIGTDGSIPIIAPFSSVEQLLGLRSLPSTATSRERLARLAEVRARAANLTFAMCYRNEASERQIQKTIEQQKAIEADNTRGVKHISRVVYGLPAEACGPVMITKDNRTSLEKRYDDNEALFRKEFGEAEPVSRKLLFRVIGINADLPQAGSASVLSLFQSMLMSSLGPGWSSPMELTSSEPVVAKIFGGRDSKDLATTRYAEFKSPDDAKKIMKEQNCQPKYDPQSSIYTNPYKDCIAKGMYYNFSAFGSSSIALDDFKKGFDRGFVIASLILSAIAAIILMGTVGRIIADSRRETAVFRAIGAKRRDIAQIYIFYTIILSLLIAIVSTIFGYVVSLIINARYSPSATVDALVAFNVSDMSQKFIMSSLYMKGVVFITGLIVVAAIVSSLLPLLTNLRRNPIQDMRDER